MEDELDTIMTPDDACQSAGNSSVQSNGIRGLPPKAKLDVRHVILVLSGKGGVGKSTVAVNLALALADRGNQVGLLDLDIHGPNIPKMLGLEKERPAVRAKTILPVRVGTNLNLAVMSMAFMLPDPSTPIIWRGPMKMSAIRQFLEDVDWGRLDYLVVDLPPGTGDEALTIAQLAPRIDGAVIVTTPQEVAVLDASKAVRFVGELEMRVLGIVENMSGMACPHCGEPIDLFSMGGGEKAARALDVPFLGAIPLDPAVARSGDDGVPYIRGHADSPTWHAVTAVMEKLLVQIETP